MQNNCCAHIVSFLHSFFKKGNRFRTSERRLLLNLVYLVSTLHCRISTSVFIDPDLDTTEVDCLREDFNIDDKTVVAFQTYIVRYKKGHINLSCQGRKS